MNKQILKFLYTPFNMGKANLGASLIEGILALGVIGIGVSANISIFSSSNVSARSTIANLSLSQLQASLNEVLHSRSILFMSAKGNLQKCVTNSGSDDCNNNSNVIQNILEPGESTVIAGSSPAYYKLNGEVTKDKSKAAYQVTISSMKALCQTGAAKCDLAADISIKYKISPYVDNFKILGAPNKGYFYKNGKSGDIKSNLEYDGESVIRVSSFKISENLTTSDCNPGSYARSLGDGHRIFKGSFSAPFTPNLLEGFKEISRDGESAKAICNDKLAGPVRGLNGTDGSRGPDGVAGVQGPRGPNGDRGPQGYRAARPGAYGGSFHPDSGSASVYIPRDNNI